MGLDLITRREHVMDLADSALDAAWPERTGADYVRKMQSAANELEEIAADMKAEGVEAVEQSRVYRYLGSIYSDLEPALGKEMLIKAKEAYHTAEALLEGYDDDLEWAKLNFNFGNTLRQIDPNDIAELQEAEERFLSARKVFAEQAPQFLGQIDSALVSVRSLLKIAPTVQAIDRNYADMEILKEDLASGGNLSEIIPKVRKLMTKDGGIAALIGKAQALTAELPAELSQSDKFAEIHQKLNSLAEIAIGGNSMGSEEEQILTMLRKRLEAELKDEKVSSDRAETLRGVIGKLGSILSGAGDDLQELLDSGQKLRDLIATQFESAHYLSHGLPRPPDGSRAAELVELCWSVRRYLLEEMNRSGKGADESKEALDLNIRAAKVDKRIYEAGDDDSRAVTVDQEELRPLVLAVRKFSARMHPMIAQPIWPTARIPIDTTAVFYSGTTDLRHRVSKICNRIGLSVMGAPKGESIANARWKQLRKAMITIFDFGFEDESELAAVAYELGIALALGKPLVVVSREERPLPFDVDVDPVILSGEPDDHVKLASALDQSLVWTYPRIRSKEVSITLDYVLAKYPRPQPDTYVDQTLRLLADQHKEPDPLTVTRTMTKLVDFLDDGTTVLIYPVWSPVYPKAGHQSLFHVMPFRPEWADAAAMVARETCKAMGIDYVRGDEVEDPNVIRSIWEQIAQATHILIDLTGFNANVALELGIAHTLGRTTFLVGQGDTVEGLFPMIAKRRFHSYQNPENLGTLVREFLQ